MLSRVFTGVAVVFDFDVAVMYMRLRLVSTIDVMMEGKESV